MSRVIVQYDPWSRMGNRMFQYAFGRILAEDKGAEFFADPLPNFPNTNNQPSPGHVGDQLWIKEKYGNHYVDYDELLATDQNIIVDSFVQKAKYYTPHREKLREWFKIDITGFITPQKDELVIHIREGDYKIINQYLGVDFYINQANKMTHSKATIVTDNCLLKSIVQLRSQGFYIKSKIPVSSFNTHNDRDIMEDFSYMLLADKLILSQSSFSWWAAFLGDHKQVIFPIAEKDKFWITNPQQDDIDLFINGMNFRKVII